MPMPRVERSMASSRKGSINDASHSWHRRNAQKNAKDWGYARNLSVERVRDKLERLLAGLSSVKQSSQDYF